MYQVQLVVTIVCETEPIYRETGWSDFNLSHISCLFIQNCPLLNIVKITCWRWHFCGGEGCRRGWWRRWRGSSSPGWSWSRARSPAASRSWGSGKFSFHLYYKMFAPSQWRKFTSGLRGRGGVWLQRRAGRRRWGGAAEELQRLQGCPKKIWKVKQRVVLQKQTWRKDTVEKGVVLQKNLLIWKYWMSWDAPSCTTNLRSCWFDCDAPSYDNCYICCVSSFLYCSGAVEAILNQQDKSRTWETGF